MSEAEDGGEDWDVYDEIGDERVYLGFKKQGDQGRVRVSQGTVFIRRCQGEEVD